MISHPIAFTVSYSGKTRVLTSDIHIAQAFNPANIEGQPSPEKINAKKFIGIWDTGATGTVISQKVIDECGLKPIGMAKVYTANQDTTSPVYFASIVLPNKLIVPSLRMVRGTVAGDADVLVGMDVIGNGDFAVTCKDGRTVYSFRVPSCELIDFVKQTKSGTPSSTVPKVGRNQPCPCGSGKKYKYCHGR